MKNLFSKILLTLALIMAVVSFSDAQLLGKKKMPVGVKSYSYYDTLSSYDMEFKDMTGKFDKYNFYALDSAIGYLKQTLVFDRARATWRLPLSRNEAMGIAEKDGEEPLAIMYIWMKGVKPAMREKIE